MMESIEPKTWNKPEIKYLKAEEKITDLENRIKNAQKSLSRWKKIKTEIGEKL